MAFHQKLCLTTATTIMGNNDSSRENASYGVRCCQSRRKSRRSRSMLPLSLAIALEMLFLAVPFPGLACQSWQLHHISTILTSVQPPSHLPSCHCALPILSLLPPRHCLPWIFCSQEQVTQPFSPLAQGLPLKYFLVDFKVVLLTLAIGPSSKNNENNFVLTWPPLQDPQIFCGCMQLWALPSAKNIDLFGGLKLCVVPWWGPRHCIIMPGAPGIPLCTLGAQLPPFSCQKQSLGGL